MVDNNLYVENPANSSMHYGNKPIVGVIDFPDKLPINRPYNYFNAQAMYNNLQQDMWVQQKRANPDSVKKGIPKIIKIALTALLSVPIIFMGAKGIKSLISKFKH